VYGVFNYRQVVDLSSLGHFLITSFPAALVLRTQLFFSPTFSSSRGRGVHVSLQPIFHRPVSSLIFSGINTFGGDIGDLLCLLAIELVRCYSYSLTLSPLLCTPVSLLFISLQAHVVSISRLTARISLGRPSLASTFPVAEQPIAAPHTP